MIILPLLLRPAVCHNIHFSTSVRRAAPLLSHYKLPPLLPRLHCCFPLHRSYLPIIQVLYLMTLRSCCPNVTHYRPAVRANFESRSCFAFLAQSPIGLDMPLWGGIEFTLGMQDSALLLQTPGTIVFIGFV